MKNNLTQSKFANIIIALVALALVLLPGCGPTGTPSQASSDKGQVAQKQSNAPVTDAATSSTRSTAGIQAKIRTIQASVPSISDGDTIHVSLRGHDEKVRFIGVNCPEISHLSLGIKEQPYGQKAKAYTEKELLGKKVWLEFDVQERDKYGRLLAYVWLEPPSSDSEEEIRAKMFNARLLLEGYAQVMTVPPNVRYQDKFLRFQTEARKAGRGLWGIAP